MDSCLMSDLTENDCDTFFVYVFEQIEIMVV